MKRRNHKRDFNKMQKRVQKAFATPEIFWSTENDEWDYDADGYCDWDHHLIIEMIEDKIEYEYSAAEEMYINEHKERMRNEQ